MQDYGELIQTHRESHADVTMATHAVGLGQASFRGCCKVESDSSKPCPAALSATILSRISSMFCRISIFWCL